MSVLNRTPADVNPLQPTKFLLSFARIPTVQYFCQKVNLPGVRMDDAAFPTPFKDLKVAGTKLNYEDLKVNFIIDEGMVGYQEMYSWFRSIGDPTGFAERKALSALAEPFVSNPDKKQYSEGTLIILNNVNIATIRVQFHNVYPISLSGIEFDTTEGAENIITGTAEFYFDYYEFVTP